jgi:stalled ribosome rescue protein Dom34
MLNREKLLALYELNGGQIHVVPKDEPSAERLEGRLGIRSYRILNAE